ncbi:hypothetical protein QRX50_46780 [Amycolatopsis carbonis]|uniref:Uncharacterized protein n=1 Tax=Amycolatopsis carbonis TaxID=715471 RepID=A0A9Y2MX79_9PSEU|nr:hypothetical protein [Amycolatopsis sp. 2-15]WIX78759.1 hypothetical protein QRX50_46780 [Amycolatopsis sp. 2-15]
MSMKAKAVLCAATAVAGLALAAPQSSAATYPTTPFTVSYGATYAQGTITWYGRSAGVSGSLRSLASSDCRSVYAWTTDKAISEPPLGQGTSPEQCGDAIKPFSLVLPADVPGGAAYTWVCLAYGNGVPITPDSPGCKHYLHP